MKLGTTRAGAALVAAAFFAATLAHAQNDASEQGMAAIRAERIRGGMRFLADDALEGRGTGSRGHEIAAKYVAAEFEAAGLAPAGEGGTYFQTVPLRASRPDEGATGLTLIRGGKEEKLVFRQDFIAPGDPGRADTSVEAPVIYVGGGVTALEQNYDDYKGVDAKGKIVALIFEAPPTFESSLRAHYSSFDVKAANAVAHGAVGMIVLDDPVLERLYSFKEQVRDLAFPQLRWLDKAGQPNDYFPQLKGGAILSMDATRRFFTGSPHSADEVFASAKEGKPLSFALPMTVRIHNVSRLEDKASQNIAGMLVGSDPVLRNECVVYTAHIDHLGIGDPVNGDKIYNGALDNASGTSILMEVARAFAQLNPQLRRSVLFVAVTGEEAGLLGSDYFAHFPTVAKDAVIANVNMDEDMMMWPLQDIVAFGAEHSSLNAIAEKAASRMRLSLSPDPMPEEAVFIRSDQYSFVKRGIPAIFPVPGFKSDDPQIKPMEIFQRWEAERYHQPSDDMNQPLNWEAAVKFAQFNFLCGYLIAQDSERPTWNKGDFFGDHYGNNKN